MKIEKILVVDDEPLMRRFVTETLLRKKIEVVSAEDGKAALHLLKTHAFDLVISDMRLPDLSGLELLKSAKETHPSLLFILMTAYASDNTAADAMRWGAFNYLIKPFSATTIEAMIEKANQQLALIEENQFLRREISHVQRKHVLDIIAESPLMKKTLQDLAKIAKSQANVFITGESGTGKEVISQAIHLNSNRANAPFIKVNCSAIPDTLIESEFFGHEKGAFTGAINRRIGRFELSHGGTLLLDEISEIPLMLQPKLLRAIQEREFERVGGVKPIQVDVRLIATSNRNMQEAVAQKLFREDLYYRLNVVPLFLPPLRERKEDIVPLAEYFLERFCSESGKPLKNLTFEARQKLQAYHWPGNIRELANVIERTVVMENASAILPEHLPLEGTICTHLSSSPLLTLAEVEKRHILDTLNHHHQNRTQAAKTLGISIRTLRNKLNSYQFLL
jgi:two-component system, NtrC family, response regulator AtoC